MVIVHRQRIIEDTDGAEPDQNAVAADMDDEELKAKLSAEGPSSEALSKMTDYGARRSFSPDAKSVWARSSLTDGPPVDISSDTLHQR